MALNIVLLSDGTGNAASSVWHTNVWRTFKSIDLTGVDQVACYDDGVGTSSFKPLAILGGAFGWGLKRNVLQLYKFLCRNYQTDSAIFAFGFSRGAYTIRVLIGLVTHQGLIPYTSEDDLGAKAIAAYRQYRRDRFGRGIGTILRPIRDLCVVIVNILLGRERYNKSSNIKVASIRFVGLWDTVAAYGLPVDEWTTGIHQYIWPLELPDRKLSPIVDSACHALSVDDERTTFHPVLWDESNVPAGKIQQVWFAGVHANVGGGYPDDALAEIPLYWIMKEAERRGFQFIVSPQQPDALRVTASARDKDGRLYDSRSGAASYYRYGPRDIEALCADPQNGVKIDRPLVHQSVFVRMGPNATAYAPIGLPQTYAVIAKDGTTVTQVAAGFETEQDAKERYMRQQLAWDLVWWRRIVYFLTVIASLHLVVFPLIYRTYMPEEYTTSFRFVSEAVRIVGTFLPSFVSTWWLDSYATNPKTLLISIGAVLLLTLWGSRLHTLIEDRMLAAWRNVDPPRSSAMNVIDRFVRSLRTANWYRAAHRFLRYKLAPAFFAIFTVAACAAIVSHVAFYLEDAAGVACTPTPNAKALPTAHTSEQLTFTPDHLCWASGIQLSAGTRYVISIEQTGPWQDGHYTTHLGGYEITSLPGLLLRAQMFALTPLRRVLLRPWFRVIARVGEAGTDEYFLPPDWNQPLASVTRLDVPVRPNRSGELYLYVNEAVLPLRMDHWYRNNRGTAKVTVMQRDH